MVLSDLDRSLISECLNQTEGAWEEFIERYIHLITHVVNSSAKLRCTELSEQARDDVVAEVLLSFVDNDYAVLRRFQGNSSLGTYLVVVARRIATRKLSQVRRTTALPSDALPEAVEQTNDSLGLDDVDEVRSLLGQLPEGEATAIRMFHLEHRNYGEIGTQMGIPENSVGPLLSQARKRMRDMR
ncbi:RNA polymerase sigma factor [Aureliella helgolandensis]|uniref:RNA polymerase sigma factor n=1 Tax=Aureliella helgolandensis TaxID=2527968 RepID=A0A518G6Q3_9BACT|nr:RNA polymerase sigma factor [Aureliella helgolandensis]